MYSVLRILVYVVLVSTTLVSSNERKKRAGAEWIDLGSSIVLPWESLNNGVPQGRNIGRVENSEPSIINNINDRYQNERDALQQLRNSFQLSNVNNRNAINSNSIEGIQRPISTATQRKNRIQQNGYSGLSSYSLISPNINGNEETQQLIGRTGPRQTQYSDQSTSLPSLGLGRSLSAQRNLGYNKISALGRQLNLNSDSQGTRSSLRTLNLVPSNARLNSQDTVQVDGRKLNQLSDVVGRLPIENIQRRIPQIYRSNAQPNQDNFRTAIPLDNVGQYNDNSDETLNQQSPIGQEDIQQYVNQRANDNRDDSGVRQSLEGIDNQQIYRVSQPSLVQLQGLENSNEQSEKLEQLRQRLIAQRGNLLENVQGQEARNQNLRNNYNIIPNSLENPVGPAGENQQRPNVYTYGELGARIWKVITSNPQIMSNLENLRSQISNGNNSENPQVRELKTLLQQVQEYNRNNEAPQNVVEQSPEEQQQNVLVANLIAAMNNNNNVVIPDQQYVQGQIHY